MSRVSSGVTGLDKILGGGFIQKGAYLIRGGPGQGKTTLGLQFLSAARGDEPCLFLGFQEADEQLRTNARSVGLNIEHVNFLNLTPDEHFFTQQERYDVFAPEEVERAPLSESITEAVERLNPQRVFIDSLTQLRFLAADVFQYRQEVLSFLHFLKARDATVLFSSEHSPNTPDDDLQFLADGVVSLKLDDFGQTLRVDKLRGSDFARGAHQMRNGSRGIEVFPRPLPPKDELNPSRFTQISSGIDKLDEMLGGGIESGTITMISGPSGIGKSTLASCIAAQAANQHQHVAIYLFEEDISSYLHRANNLQIDLANPLEAGDINVEMVEPLRYLADEFASKLYRELSDNQARVVVFDSIAGFQLTLKDESIKSRLHALAKSLSRMNISVLLVNETASLFGDESLTEKGISYLADNVITMNYARLGARPASTIQVMKKRLSAFDTDSYRFTIGPRAINIDTNRVENTF